jgi:hypothetical protein
MRRKQNGKQPIGREKNGPIRTTFMELIEELSNLTGDDALVLAAVRSIWDLPGSLGHTMPRFAWSARNGQFREARASEGNGSQLGIAALDSIVLHRRITTITATGTARSPALLTGLPAQENGFFTAAN